MNGDNEFLDFLKFWWTDSTFVHLLTPEPYWVPLRSHLDGDRGHTEILNHFLLRSVVKNWSSGLKLIRHKFDMRSCYLLLFRNLCLVKFEFKKSRIVSPWRFENVILPIHDWRLSLWFWVVLILKDRQIIASYAKTLKMYTSKTKIELEKSDRPHLTSCLDTFRYIVGSWGVIQLGGLVPVLWQ